MRQDPALEALSLALQAVLALVVSACAAWWLARLATRRGWGDDGSAAPLRKLQARAVPCVGGSAIVIALCAAQLVASALGTSGPFARAAPLAFWFGTQAGSASERGWWAAVLCAYALGLIDDRLPRGLSAGVKACGQCVCGGVLAFACGDGLAPAQLAFIALAVVIAQNAINTFDNADGAASALTLAGTLVGAPVSAAALAGFLPFNLWLRVRSVDARGRDTSTPRAYLGDSGSHVLGLLLLASPIGYAALCLPLFDLARVSVARVRAGSRPWIGDRRHVAHRLSAAGRSRSATVLVLLAVALPTLGAAAWALRTPRVPFWPSVAVGMLLSAVAFALVLRATPESS